MTAVLMILADAKAARDALEADAPMFDSVAVESPTPDDRSDARGTAIVGRVVIDTLEAVENVGPLPTFIISCLEDYAAKANRASRYGDARGIAAVLEGGAP